MMNAEELAELDAINAERLFELNKRGVQLAGAQERYWTALLEQLCSPVGIHNAKVATAEFIRDGLDQMEPQIAELEAEREAEQRRQAIATLNGGIQQPNRSTRRH